MIAQKKASIEIRLRLKAEILILTGYMSLCWEFSDKKMVFLLCFRKK